MSELMVFKTSSSSNYKSRLNTFHERIKKIEENRGTSERYARPMTYARKLGLLSWQGQGLLQIK